MSKAVTFTTGAICLESSGESVAMATDGNIYHVGPYARKGDELNEDHVCAITKAGLARIKKCVPALIKAASALKKVDKIKEDVAKLAESIEASDMGAVRFVATTEEEDAEEIAGKFGIGVGCTFIEIKDVPGVLKKLGVK